MERLPPPRRRLLRRRERPLPVLHFVPNMFTILGLCAGMTGMRFAFDGRWQMAVAFIIAAAIFDGLDGRSARLLKMTSKLGEQLDSLADFISFGVAPAVIVYLWVLHELRGFGWALALVFATCSALRLARFNAELEAPERPAWALHYFTGVPAPAAAGLALLPLMASFVIGADFVRHWLVSAAVLLLVAVLMVSRVPTFSVKRLRIKPHLVVPTFIAGIFVTVLLITEVWLMLSLIGLAYLGSIPVSWVMAKRMERAARLEAGAGPGVVATAAESAEKAPPSPTGGSASEPTGSEASSGNATGGERGSVFRLGDRGKQP
jgi:CDP-diacylglycerol---serine O-phosphatidyltransferase